MQDYNEAELATYEPTHTRASTIDDRLNEYSPDLWDLEEEGLWVTEGEEPNSYRHEQSVLTIGRERHPHDSKTREYTAHLNGFLDACMKDQRYASLGWLLMETSNIRVNNTQIQALVAKHRSPGRATRVMLAARRRANAILAPWGLRVSSYAFALALSHSCRPGRVARKAALWTLQCAFGLEGRADMAAFRGTSRGYRRLVAAAESAKEVRRVLTELSWEEPDTPRNRLAHGLAAVRRMRYAYPWTPLSDLVHYRTVACGDNTVCLMAPRWHGTDHPYTLLPRWYLRRREYIIRMDADGTRTFLLQGSKTRVGICTAWRTAERSEWYVEGPRGRTYHARGFDADESVFVAKCAWRTQRRIDRRHRRDVQRSRNREQYLSQYLQEARRTILVRVSDSVETGNCQFGTEQWRDTYFAGKYVVPLQALLPHRENHAVSRVISAVLEREMTQAE